MKPEDDDAKTASIGLGDLEANRESRDIFSRERVWRNRTTILQESVVTQYRVTILVEANLMLTPKQRL